MKIVPTIYEDLDGIRRYPYQFTFVYRVQILMRKYIYEKKKEESIHPNI